MLPQFTRSSYIRYDGSFSHFSVKAPVTSGRYVPAWLHGRLSAGATARISIMSDKATLKLERGTKRTCQNADCGERFYDLNRDPITCPICNSMYAIALQPPPPAPARPTSRPLKRPVPIPDEVKEQAPAAEDGEELAA